MLAHRLQCWTSIKPALVQRLVFAGLQHCFGSAHCWRRVQADTDRISVKCWASIACDGQYLFSPSQYFMLAVPACWRYRHDALSLSWVIVGLPSVTLVNIQRGAKHDTVTQYWANVGSASLTVGQHYSSIGSTSRV